MIRLSPRSSSGVGVQLPECRVPLPLTSQALDKARKDKGGVPLPRGLRTMTCGSFFNLAWKVTRDRGACGRWP